MTARRGRRIEGRGLALASGLLLAGCRSCSDEPAGTQPPMPTGMLVPAPAPAGSAESLVARFQGSRSARPGRFQITVLKDGGTPAEGRWVSPDAMTIMENAFGRAQPGFTPYARRDVAPENVVALAKELRALRAKWLALRSPGEARAVYGALVVSEGEKDDVWASARDAFAATLEDLAAYCEEVAKRGEGVEVRGG